MSRWAVYPVPQPALAPDRSSLLVRVARVDAAPIRPLQWGEHAPPDVGVPRLIRPAPVEIVSLALLQGLLQDIDDVERSKVVRPPDSAAAAPAPAIRALRGLLQALDAVERSQVVRPADTAPAAPAPAVRALRGLLQALDEPGAARLLREAPLELVSFALLAGLAQDADDVERPRLLRVPEAPPAVPAPTVQALRAFGLSLPELEVGLPRLLRQAAIEVVSFALLQGLAQELDDGDRPRLLLQRAPEAPGAPSGVQWPLRSPLEWPGDEVEDVGRLILFEGEPAPASPFPLWPLQAAFRDLLAAERDPKLLLQPVPFVPGDPVPSIRALVGLVQALVDVGPPRLLQIIAGAAPPAVTEALWPLRSALEWPGLEVEDLSHFFEFAGIVPPPGQTLPIWALQPLVRDALADEGLGPRILRQLAEQAAAPAPAVRALRGLLQFLEEPDRSRLYPIVAPDVAAAPAIRALRGLLQFLEAPEAGRLLRIVPADAAPAPATRALRALLEAVLVDEDVSRFLGQFLEATAPQPEAPAIRALMGLLQDIQRVGAPTLIPRIITAAPTIVPPDISTWKPTWRPRRR